MDDILQHKQNERSFNHNDEHKPDRAPRWIGAKHNGKYRDVHREERRQHEPKPKMSNITLVLSENGPQQKTSPKG
jgi:hypothetical protein